MRELIPDMLSSFTVNIAYHANNPEVGMSLEKDAGRYKLFLSDVGLFVTLIYKDKNYTENVIYNKLLSDKLESNLCRFRINGAPFSRQRCKRLAPAVRCPFIACL